MKTNKRITMRGLQVTVLTSLLSIGALGGCVEESSVEESIQDDAATTKTKTKTKTTMTKETMIRNRLVESLQDATAFQTSQTKSKVTDFISKSPISLAQTFALKGDFQLDSVKKNGRALYRSQTGPEVLKIAPEKGYMKYMENGSVVRSADVRRPIGIESAKKRARQYFLDMGLSEDEVKEIKVSPIMEVDIDENNRRSDPVVVAHVVDFTRQIDGIEVFDSSARMFIDLEGKAFRAHVRWPKFQLSSEEPTLNNDSFLKEMSGILKNKMPKNHNVRQLSSKMGYWFNENTLTFEPAVRTFTVWENAEPDMAGNNSFTPFNEQVTYSLVNGVIN